MRTFFHTCPTGTDPATLLDPERQFTIPWGPPDHGACDKCEGEGTVRYECKSCLVEGADPECPACEGRVHFAGTCPACEGTGKIDRTRRRGIAVFPTLGGLYRYLAERDADVGRMVVELEGEQSDDIDLDADCGVLLVHPAQIVSVRPLESELIAEIKEGLSPLEQSA